MTRVIVTFDDGTKLPMEGPNVDKTLKGSNPEKVFKDIPLSREGAKKKEIERIMNCR